MLTNCFGTFGIKVVILNVTMNIAKYFDKNSKKRNLSGNSNPQEETKKIRDGSSAGAIDNCDVFKEGLKSPECKEILFNCLRNLQEKVTEIFNLAQDTRNIQMKGDKELEELKSSVELMSDKFDEYEKEKIIDGLQNEVSSLKERIDLLEKNLTIVAVFPQKLFTSAWSQRTGIGKY